MRQAPPLLYSRWMLGEYIGDARPTARITVQTPNIELHQTPDNLFASLIFGGGGIPRELPNVKSVNWQRGVDADVATCTVELWNTEPLPIGAALTPDLDRPGWFTYNRGSSTRSGQWGHEVNEWSHMLMPDNILRTFEGYGHDAEVTPEFDPNLMQTGVWMIDDVDYSHDGTITVACRDVGRILIDQISFPPVTPFKSGFVTKDLPDGAYAYPVSFQGKNSDPTTETGFAPVSLATSRLGATYRASSNGPYTGDGPVFGHYPRDAFDDDDATYWLSIGNARPDQGYSFEWIEGGVKRQTVSRVRFKSRYAGHTAYLCLFVDGQGWVGTNVVPYDPNHPSSAPNGSNTPFHSSQQVTGTGWTEFSFSGVSNVSRVRITFGNLQHSGLGTYPYRAGVRRFEVYGGGGGGSAAVQDDFQIEYDIQNVILDADQPPFPWGGSTYAGAATLDGTWRLTFNGQQTAKIQWDAGAAGVKAALEALTNVDQVNVSGSGTSGSPFVVEFVGEMVRGQQHPLMTMKHSLLRHNHSTTRVFRASQLPMTRTITFEDKNYDDYTDIVKLLCAWGGFFWPRNVVHQISDAPGDEPYYESEELVRERIIQIYENRGFVYNETYFDADVDDWVQKIWFDETHTIGQARTAIDFLASDQGAEELLSEGFKRFWGYLEDDPAITIEYGRVWGDFQQSGTAGPAPIPASVFDKKPLMDGIAYIRDILGYLFYVDELGSAVFRSPNIYAVGNTFFSAGSEAGERTTQMHKLDERTILIGLTAKLSSRNVRERTFVSNTTGIFGHMAAGWNPNPIGLRRVGGWTDQNFETDEECLVMAEMIALRQLFSYRSDRVTISGFPGIQVDDQVRIFERVTSEGYIHYVKGISSSLDHQTGEYTYELDTHWLGEQPFERWVFDPEQLSDETQAFLRGLHGG